MANDNSLYLQHEDTIDSVLALVRRVHRLNPDEGDEFSSYARLHLLEDNCAVLRRFKGLSSFKTFLITTVNRLYLDWRDKGWGKWRPTSAAREIGPLAIELELLVLRDRLDYAEAVQLLLSKKVARSETECDEVWARLRRRPRRRLVDLMQAPDTPVAAFDAVRHSQKQLLTKRIMQALQQALLALPDQDRLIFKMRYLDGFSVAQIAKHLATEQKPLYRRFEQINRQLKESILAAGISKEDIHEVLEDFDFDDGDKDDEEPGNGEGGPSTPVNAGGVLA